MCKTCADMQLSSIDKDVKSLLKQSGYTGEANPYVDIIDFVRKYGFKVVNADLNETDDGFIIATPDIKLIAVNKERSLEWKRFIIAHEFGHYVLHPANGKSYLYRKRENIKGKNDCENAADYFAAVLLMPEESFTKQYEQMKSEEISDNVICMQLSSVFKVPLESVSRRIQELKL